MWSDGYAIPDELTIEGLERKLAEVYHVDPYRYKEFPAVGYLLDDRTALEIRSFDDWSRLDMEEIKPLFHR